MEGEGRRSRTTEIMRRMKERPGSHRSLKALFSSLPGPLAVALNVITLQKSLAVIARQHACKPRPSCQLKLFWLVNSGQS